MFHYLKGGLNQQYRRLHMRRYVIYACLFVVCGCTQILDYLVQTGEIETPLWSQYLCAAYYAIAPLLYAIIRI
jgi:hypothetical protein